jgi:hypothetical protein
MNGDCKSASVKSLETEATLPEPLRPAYRQLVDEYAFLATVKTGRGYVCYSVLANLVRAGWRQSAERTEDSQI